jgi:tetratricopeptide (TPR) repeat protein
VRQTHKIAAIFVIVVAVLAGLSLFRFIGIDNTVTTESSPASLAEAGRLLQSAQQALQAKAFADAERLALDAVRIDPKSDSAWLIAAQAAGELGKVTKAVEYCDSVTDDSGPQARVARWVPCELLLRQGQLSQVLERLTRLLERFPDHVEARQRIVYVLTLAGRRWETVPHLLELVRRAVDVHTMVFLVDIEKPVDYSDTLQKFADAAPNDPLPLLGLATIAIAEDRLQQASQYLQNASALDPDPVQMQAVTGRLMLRQSEFDALESWVASLEGAAKSNPDIWMTRGLLAKEAGRPAESIRCFTELLRAFPCASSALYSVGQQLIEIGRPEQAEAILDYHRKTLEYMRACQAQVGRQPSLDSALQAARLAVDCGRYWEAWGWIQIAGANASTEPRIIDAAAHLKPLLVRVGDAWCDAAVNPALAIDVNDLPLPPTSDRQSAPNADANRLATPEIQFVDQAQQTNFQFNYFSSPDPTTEGKRIYEFGGGGVGVIDFDNDGWSDVYMTQGCQWPVGSGDLQHRNALFRNASGERFLECGGTSRSDDSGFGQGVAVGDLNGDGFDDLYVANIGRNRLYINQGDGTFVDSTDRMVSAESRWTTSCAIVDLSGDGNPEIFDVNYLTGEDLFDRICVWEGGRKRICGPATFDPAADQLWTGDGAGGFVDISDTSGIAATHGNGLGIVAGDFDHDGQIELFIANDQQRNFYYRRRSSTDAGSVQFDQRALLAGLALDGEGNMQACMGVAAGDLSGDGWLDLFVTNFYRESNTYYAQLDSHDFEDRTLRAGLRSPSFQWLGFGTQCLDADLDGRLDLVLTNGHLDDFTYLNQPYEMPAQFFWNRSAERFEELSPAALGPFFQTPRRGRGLALVDWNRDGLDDFVVSHLDTPAALVTNTTNTNGRRALTVRLRGTKSARDAIGAFVTLITDWRTTTRHMTAGDGYQASNEHKLLFALEPSEKIERVEVRWPAGDLQVVESSEVDGNRLLIIENGRAIADSATD